MDPDLFRRMQEAALRFKSGESDVEEIMTPNGLARLVRDPSSPPGFRIDFVGGGARHSVSVQEYPASPTRSPGYPAPLPFLANCVAIVDTAKQSVTWYDPAEPDRAVERVTRECTADGWTRVESGLAAGDTDGSAWVFHKGGVERTLRLVRDAGDSRILLREKRLVQG
ncbi:MAG: hypothetical protein EXR91_02130 [Gemmatimonadetes bacterium]|nr:hypothetical protein [Gemmatimonadota bacterium]